MSLLSGLVAGTIAIRGLGQIGVAEITADILTNRGNRFRGQMSTVGTHISNKTHTAKITDLHTFIQLLSGSHRIFSGKTQPIGCLLLKRRCNKRGGRL